MSPLHIGTSVITLTDMDQWLGEISLAIESSQEWDGSNEVSAPTGKTQLERAGPRPLSTLKVLKHFVELKVV